jgi:hypothetical protein
LTAFSALQRWTWRKYRSLQREHSRPGCGVICNGG